MDINQTLKLSDNTTLQIGFNNFIISLQDRIRRHYDYEDLTINFGNDYIILDNLVKVNIVYNKNSYQFELKFEILTKIISLPKFEMIQKLNLSDTKNYKFLLNILFQLRFVVKHTLESDMYKEQVEDYFIETIINQLSEGNTITMPFKSLHYDWPKYTTYLCISEFPDIKGIYKMVVYRQLDVVNSKHLIEKDIIKTENVLHVNLKETLKSLFTNNN